LNVYTVDEEANRKKKGDSLRSAADEDDTITDQQRKWITQRNVAWAILREKFNYTANMIIKESEKYGIKMPLKHSLNQQIKAYCSGLGSGGRNNTTSPTEDDVFGGSRSGGSNNSVVLPKLNR